MTPLTKYDHSPRERIDHGGTVQILTPWPPSVNGYWRSIVRRKGSKSYPAQILSEAAREYIELVYTATYNQSLSNLFGDRKVSLEIHYHPKRRGSDIDNFTKGLLDGLTKSKVWDDDKQIIRVVKNMRKPVKGGLIVIYARLATEAEIEALETAEVGPGAKEGLW